MSEETSLPPVLDDEILARFILYRGWIRASNQTVKSDAFIPHPYPNLFVTRHAGLSIQELWELGQAVADQRPATLYGRADVRAAIVKDQLLHCIPTAVPKNHVNLTGWPADKAAQKIIALEIAAAARYIPRNSSVTTSPKEGLGEG